MISDGSDEYHVITCGGGGGGGGLNQSCVCCVKNCYNVRICMMFVRIFCVWMTHNYTLL